MHWKLVPCGQVYKVNAVISDYLLESVMTVYNCFRDKACGKLY